MSGIIDFYFNNGSTGYLILALIVVLILFSIILLLYIQQRSKSKSLAKVLNTIKDNCSEVENKYNTQKGLYDNLNIKYEEAIKSRDNLRNIAFIDTLTSLPNRNAYLDMLDNIMLTFRQEEVVAIMCIDIDDFKKINDLLGQSYGDELLLDITHRIKQILDENDYLARVGGDEFVIVTQNTVNTEVYEEKIKKIRNVFSYPFTLSTAEYFINISIGVVFAPKDGKNSKVLTRNLYAALQVSKASGKNTYSYYDQSFNDVETGKIEFQSEIRNAIQNDEFNILYQPIIDLETNKIAAFEALVRWNNPQRGLMQPKDFLKEAEENGLIVPIGNYVMRKACEQLKIWHDEGYENLNLAVNISPRQFRDKAFVQTLNSIVSEIGIDASKLELEITEEVVMHDPEMTLSCIRELQESGIQFSLDDFGTGYSSVNYLRVLPLNNLKIDRKLVKDLIEDSKSRMIVGAIITLGKYMGFSIIAEGVESPEQEEFLQAMKCNKAQGYLYSEPLKAADVNELLKNM